jgi:hypothetical protein
MACGPKEYSAHAESCLRRARTVRNQILAKEFEKLAQSWLRLAKAAELGIPPVRRETQKRQCQTSSVPRLKRSS